MHSTKPTMTQAPALAWALALAKRAVHNIWVLMGLRFVSCTIFTDTRAEERHTQEDIQEVQTCIQML